MSSHKNVSVIEASEYYKGNMVNIVRNSPMPLTLWELNDSHSKLQGEAILKFRPQSAGESTATVKRNINKLYHGFETSNLENRRAMMMDAVLGAKNYVKDIK